MNEVDLNWYAQYYESDNLIDNYNGTTQDYYLVTAYDGFDRERLQFGGFNITVNGDGDITGGTVTSIVEIGVNGSYIGTLWQLSGISVSATQINQAAFTESNADELALIASGLTGDDTINLNNGNDWVRGYGGNDTISGFGGNDELYGDGGNDWISGGAGDDLIDGGSGTDTVSYLSASTGVTVNLGASGTQNTGWGLDTLVGIENVEGSQFNDTITGVGNGATSSLWGMGGNDTLVISGPATVTAYGGAGDDTYSVKFSTTLGVELVENANEGVDLVISEYTWTLGLNLENLTLVGVNASSGTGNGLDNVITGSEFNNSLSGLDGNDTLNGNGGADTLFGGNGNDTLFGGDGNDTLDGGTGNDHMEGGEGNDTYYIDSLGDSATEVVGTGGIDTIVSSVTVNLGEAFETLFLTGTANVDGTGGAQNNALTGNAGDNVLRGLAGDDGIVGGAGNDTLDGGSGNDILNGGEGVDTAVVAGNRSAYTITQTSKGVFSVVGTDGTDTLTNVEFLKFDDQTVRLRPGTGVPVDFNADPSTYMPPIRDFDGNDLGGSNGWKLNGAADVNGDGDVDHILVNKTIGRFAEVGTASDGLVYFDDHGWAGETRVVGIYIDPLVQSGQVQAGSDHDSQRRFQNDLQIDNIKKVLGAGDYDHNGLQEVYFALTDGTAYLHAYMHADGNIQYANYQNQQQVIDYLSSNGWAASTYDGWFS